MSPSPDAAVTDSDSTPHIRLARADDDDFILALAERFVSFELPRWRKRSETLAGIRADIARHLRELPAASHLYVAEDEDATRLGFLHLQTHKDFFTGVLNCHISDLVVAPDHDGKGIGSALIAFADRWAKEHRCRHVTLGVFPGNERARQLYERHGFGVEQLRMTKAMK
jgi:ribosomal protein S18 acetylase RimI-like enzyme